MQPDLKYVRELAAQAGGILLEHFNGELDVQHKSRTDLVTVADHAVEKFLISAIRERYPAHAIIAEESGHWEGNASHQWYIDPLDGTLNYAHGVPIFCVSIGYAHQGQMALGVVYDPTRGEFFCAERGRGATLNDVPIHVSDYSELVDCMLVTGFPRNVSDTGDDNNENFLRFNGIAQTVRRLGSAALNIVYVAAGRMDGFWEVEIFPWDVAAGGLIVREAGGMVTNVFGNYDFMQEPISFLCANPVVHNKMLTVLAEIRQAKQTI